MSDNIAEKSFQIPPYLNKLIDSIADDAKMAYTGATWFAGVGLYLAAISVSMTDEQILLGRSTNVTQLNVSVPLLVNVAIAPVVFLLLHGISLVRYSIATGRLRHFRNELAATITTRADRDRCWRLLQSVEFILRPETERFSLGRLLMRYLFILFFLTLFPVLVLVLMESSSLRIQSDALSQWQHCIVVLDLFMVGVFLVTRQARDRHARRWRSMMVVVTPLFLVGVIQYVGLNVAQPEDQPDRTLPAKDGKKDVPIEAGWWAGFLDKHLCTAGTESNKSAGWDFPFLCRFLTVSNRVLVDPVWSADAIADLRNERYVPDQECDRSSDKTCGAVSIASVQGASLHGRMLRFANFTQIELYRADLNHADLRSAVLLQAGLIGATFYRARLDKADLSGARLQRAYLGKSCLKETKLRETKMLKADLSGADLTGADLTGADLTCANLRDADLSGTQLSGVDFTCADMTGIKGLDNPKVIVSEEHAQKPIIWAGIEDEAVRTKLKEKFGITDTGIKDEAIRTKLKEKLKIADSVFDAIISCGGGNERKGGFCNGKAPDPGAGESHLETPCYLSE